MTVMDKYLEFKRQETLKMFCPVSFGFLRDGMENTKNPETCDENCETCWNAEWKEN